MDPRPDRPSDRAYKLPPERHDLGQPGPELTLFAPIGSIRVQSSAVAFLDKTLTISADSEEAAIAVAADCRIRLRRGEVGDTIVDLPPPPGTMLDAIGADFRLALPDGIDLRLRTRAGLVDATRHAPRRALIETGEGAVLMGSVAESLQITTDSGRIELTGEFGTARISSRSGNLEVGLWRHGSKLEFRSTRGNCTLIAPSGAPVEVVYRTRRGRLASETMSETLEQGSSGEWVELRLLLPGTTTAAPASAFVETEFGDLLLTGTTGG
jgi:hypothetical protein